MKWLFLIVTIFSASCIIAQERSKHENEILAVINELREDPSLFLAEVVLPYIETNELYRSSYARSLIRDLKKQSPLPTFSIDSSLQKMAQEFADKSGKKGSFGHRKYTQRYEQYGSHLNYDGENIQYGLRDPVEIVIDLLIDESIPSLGHRKNLLSKDFSVIGIGFAPHTKMQTITVMAFGGF
jgi:uncharacterized protein YkwD